MILGLLREVKPGERRVALGPPQVQALASRGHEVRVERGAGAGVGEGDDAYRAAGARLVDRAGAWAADLVVKVKELQESELEELPQGRTLFAFMHLPGVPQRTRALAAKGTTAIAFEMVRDSHGGFPLLAPMSTIAGRMAIDVALEPRRAPLHRVVILGAGHAGAAAARAAAQAGATVTMLRRGTATPDAIERAVLEADLVVGAVFVPASPTPKLVPRALVRRMRRGAMIVDISIDAGGVAETTRATTHDDPVYVEEGVIHYAVANMPAARPREAAEALWAAALPHVEEMAREGIAAAMRDNGGLRSGVLLWRGRLNHAGIAAEAGLACEPLQPDDLR